MEHNFKFTDIDCLDILDALDYLIKDEERHTVDRQDAKLIRNKILETVKKDYERLNNET